MADEPRDNTAKPFDYKKPLKQFVTLAVIFSVVYFSSQAIQTFLGKRAAKATGLPTISLEDAFALSEETNKPVLVDVSAYWCPACRKLDNEVLANQQVRKKILDEYVFSRVDYDSPQGKLFVKNYQVKGTPTLLVLNQHGDVLRRLWLTFDPQKFIDQL